MGSSSIPFGQIVNWFQSALYDGMRTLCIPFPDTSVWSTEIKLEIFPSSIFSLEWSVSVKFMNLYGSGSSSIICRIREFVLFGDIFWIYFWSHLSVSFNFSRFSSDFDIISVWIRSIELLIGCGAYPTFIQSKKIREVPWNAPKSNTLTFCLFSVQNLTTCFFIEMPFTCFLGLSRNFPYFKIVSACARPLKIIRITP